MVDEKEGEIIESNQVAFDKVVALIKSSRNFVEVNLLRGRWDKHVLRRKGKLVFDEDREEVFFLMRGGKKVELSFGNSFYSNFRKIRELIGEEREEIEKLLEGVANPN